METGCDAWTGMTVSPCSDEAMAGAVLGPLPFTAGGGLLPPGRR